MAWIAAAVLIGIIAIAFLCSCGTKRKVTEYVAVHDTTYITHSDTVTKIVTKTKTDTVREVTVREVTLMRDTAGKTDTVRIETVSDHYRYAYVGDSTAVYRVAVDSILIALDRQRDKSAVKARPVIDWWLYAVFAVLFLGGCVAVLRSR